MPDAPLRMSADPEPPRKTYQLKPRDFERVNAVPADPTAPPASPATPANGPTDRIDVQDLYRQAATPGPALGHQKPASAPNEVHALLRENLARANAAGANDLAAQPRRRSRRLRDYLIAMFAVNAFLAYWAFGPYANGVTFVYGLAGMVFFSCGFSWVMWAVVDDY